MQVIIIIIIITLPSSVIFQNKKTQYNAKIKNNHIMIKSSFKNRNLFPISSCFTFTTLLFYYTIFILNYITINYTKVTNGHTE